MYNKLLEYDITARAFYTRNTIHEEPIEELLDTEEEFESPVIRRRKMFLRWYLVNLCSDPTQVEFWEYLDQVG